MTRQLYRALLRLYPAPHRAAFAAEMLATFDRSALDRGTSLRFAAAELGSLTLTLFSEWLAKWANPAGYLTDHCDPLNTGLPLEPCELQKRIRLLISRMEFAIAHHDFPGARRYAREESAAREQLNHLLGS